MESLCISSTSKTLSVHDSLLLHHVSKNIEIYIAENKTISKFQVGYMSFTALKHNKEFKYQVEKLLNQSFKVQQSKPQKKCQTKIALVF